MKVNIVFSVKAKPRALNVFPKVDIFENIYLLFTQELLYV